MKKNNKYQQASRARKAKAGYVRHEFWIRPQWLAKIQKLMASLRKERSE